MDLLETELNMRAYRWIGVGISELLSLDFMAFPVRPKIGIAPRAIVFTG